MITKEEMAKFKTALRIAIGMDKWADLDGTLATVKAIGTGTIQRVSEKGATDDIILRVRVLFAQLSVGLLIEFRKGNGLRQSLDVRTLLHRTRRGTPRRLESIARVLKATDQRPKLVA